MTTEQIFKALKENFPKTSLEWVEGVKEPVSGVKTGDDAIIVSANNLLEICKILKTAEKYSFDCLSSLTAVDRSKDQNVRFDVVYHLFSYKHRHSLTLKVQLPREEGAHIETVESIWNAANWLEREVYDLFGIGFDHHSDLRRIMLPDDWIGYPLRKDYNEAEDYHGIATTRPPLL